MRSGSVGVSAAVVAMLVLAGCGGTKIVTVTKPTRRATVTTPEYIPLPTLTSATYDVVLTDFKNPAPPFEGGEPKASGAAVITIDPASSQLCWKISELMNVTAPTAVHLFRYVYGLTGRLGYVLGHGYSASGCQHEREEALQAIERIPKQIYLSINSARYPGGAVHGPLEATTGGAEGATG